MTRVCSSTPLQGYQNYSNSRVSGYGLLGKLSLIIRQLERILIKLAKISVSAMARFLVGSRERHHSGVIVWETWIDGLVCASYLKTGTRSSGLAKSNMALVHLNPTSLCLDTCA